MALLGGLISAAGGLLSGILGDKAASKQNQQQIAAIRANNRAIEQQNAKRIQTLVKDARAAGIHPLAALGSSVAGSFATPQAAYGGAPITGSAAGDAVKAFGDNLQVDNEQGALQRELLKAQIRNVDASTANLLSQATSRGSFAADTNSTRLFPFGELHDDPGFSTAQQIQDKYGDIAENVFGTAKMLHDIQKEREKVGKRDPSPAVAAGREFMNWFQKNFGIRPAY